MRIIVDELPCFASDCIFSEYFEDGDCLCKIDCQICDLDCNKSCTKLSEISEHIGWIERLMSMRR